MRLSDQIVDTAAQFGWSLDHDRLPEFTAAIGGLTDSYRRLAELDTKHCPEPVPRKDAGRPPGITESSAWAWRCSIQDQDAGGLAGVSVAIKDSIAVAGLPTVMGSALLMQEGTQHIALEDATVVRRLLDAGAIITGKSTTEDLCIGGSSCTSLPQPVENPHLPGRSAGGSSSGSAALLTSGEVDLALGADQGGSIRIPAALCGVVGLKPTFGLVPFTGVQGLVWGLDHVGPMARTVREVAAALDVLSGSDGIDHRCAPTEIPLARAALDESIDGLRVGILTEGFELTTQGETEFPGSAAAAELVRERAWALTNMGLQVVDISIPLHDEARHIYGPLLVETAAINIWRAYGQAGADRGPAGDTPVASIIQALSAYPELASDPTKLVAIAGSLFLDHHRGDSLASAARLTQKLKTAYDKALCEVDVLVHPTTAPAGVSGYLPAPGQGVLVESLSYFHNTCATNLTGHPSVSVPVGQIDRAPVGMHITGKHFADATILQVASAIEVISSR